MTMPDNPYATPQATAPEEEPSAPVTMRMRWLFMVMFSLAAFLQIKMGVTAIKGGYFPSEAMLRAFPDRGGAPWFTLRYALFSWVSFGILNVVLVVLWLRNRPGRQGESERLVEAAAVESIGREEAIRILKEQAMSRFGIKEDQFGMSLARSLRFAPGEVSGFIEDLEVDYGFALADEVNASTASVQDLLDALARLRG